VGMKLVGKVNLCSPDHVSLLVHRTFNVSIPRHHIPTDQWEFEYGPAENDPEFGVKVVDDEGGIASTSEGVEGSGRWVHKTTGEKLGGEGGQLDFTVIGLTIANQMLSLIGSIQLDPFSPEHAPDHSITTTSTSRRQSATQKALGMEDIDLTAEDIDSDDEVDTFETLGRLTNDEEAAKEEERRKEEQGDIERKEKKRKRKAEKMAVAAAVAGDGEAQPEKKKKKKKTSS